MTEHEDDDPLIDEIHEIRRQISARFGNDPARLVEHYMKYQKQFKDRLISTREAKAREKGKPAA